MRQEAAQVFVTLNLARAAQFLRTLYSDDLAILAYHRVCDIPDESRYPFDVELMSTTPTEFAWQMEYVKTYFNPITFAQLLEAIDGKQALPPRPVIVTFDDGFDDNYHHAFPVLKRLQVPATFFLSTGYIGAPKTFWYDWLAYIVLHMPPGALAVGAQPVQVDADIKARRRAFKFIVEYLKRVPNAQRLEILDTIDRQYGALYQGDDMPLSKTMNWDQVKEMALAGMEIGSHTVTHPILSNLSESEIQWELTTSKQQLEQILGVPVTTIAYPVGRHFAFNERVRTLSEQAGYRLGISFETGINRMKALARYALRRVPVGRQTDRALFASMLSFPEVFLRNM